MKRKTPLLCGVQGFLAMALDVLKRSFGARSRNRTGIALRRGDFKSPASTNFAIRAC